MIALQEVWTNNPFAPDAQQAERLAELLPNHHWVYWPAFDLDAGEVADDGTVVNRRLQFGQMVLSRFPIEYSRSLDLPMVEPGHLRKQRTVIEALITTPAGPLRVYSAHIDSFNQRARLAQIEWLVDHVTTRASVNNTGIAVPSDPDVHTEAVVMGDMNHRDVDPEYDLWVGAMDWYYGRTVDHGRLVDVWDLANPGQQGLTWRDEHRDHELVARLDYAFVTAGLAGQVETCWIDTECIASDHQPVWFTLRHRSR